MRKGVGLPQSQLLIVEGVPEYAAHHGNVLQEEEEQKEEEASHAKFKRESSEGGETQMRHFLSGPVGSGSRHICYRYFLQLNAERARLQSD